MKKERNQSFVVVSDFHSCNWPLEKIEKYYLNEYETIYILGDATDRGENFDGTGGIDLLRRIKKLSEMYPGRVIYVPGNHDQFLYEYAKYGNPITKQNIIYNCGQKTIEDIDTLKRNNIYEFNNLINWLGNLPIQREHYYNGKRYALAHALFDEKLFQKNRYFSLEDFRKDPGNVEIYKDILWFRKKENSYYDPTRLPRKDTTMIIGHTPLRFRKDKNLDLKNGYGETIKVVCVDGGIAYDDQMLKYVKGNNQNGLHLTVCGTHASTPNIKSRKEEMTDAELGKYINCIIISIIKNSSTLDEAVEKLIQTIYYNNNQRNFIFPDDNNRKIKMGRVAKYIENIYMSYIPSFRKITKEDIDYKKIFKLYFTKVALDYISNCLLKKFGTVNNVSLQMKSYFQKNNSKYITNSIGRARDVADKVGIENFIIWFNSTNYKTFDEYLESVFGRQFEK